MNRKIGEKFEVKGKQYEVRESGVWYSCQGCAFNEGHHPSSRCYENGAALLGITGECSGAVRDDGKYVYFARVKQ